MWTPIAVQLLTLIVLLAGGWFALQVAIYTRGGELSRSWHLLVAATLVFALQEVLELMAQLQVLELAPWAWLITKLVIALCLALGFFHQMRSLS